MSSRVRHQPQPPLPSPTHMDRHRLLAEQDVQPAQMTPRLAPDRLKQAVFDGDVAAVRQYVVDGANANLLYSESLGASLLFVAAQQGHAEVVDHLLESGARPDARQVSGCTPLFVAARHGHAPVVAQLAAVSSAEVNHASYAKELPVHAAAENGHAAVLRVLVQHGAILDRLSGVTKKTPLFGAVDACSPEAVEVLLDAIILRCGFVALWVIRRPWRDPAGREWSPLELAKARGQVWEGSPNLKVVDLLEAAEGSGTVGAQQRLAWAKVGVALFDPEAEQPAEAEVEETPGLLLLAIRRQNARQSGGAAAEAKPAAAALAAVSGPGTQRLIGEVGRLVGLQPAVAVAMRARAEQRDVDLAEEEQRKQKEQDEREQKEKDKAKAEEAAELEEAKAQANDENEQAPARPAKPAAPATAPEVQQRHERAVHVAHDNEDALKAVLDSDGAKLTHAGRALIDSNVKSLAQLFALELPTMQKLGLKTMDQKHLAELLAHSKNPTLRQAKENVKKLTADLEKNRAEADYSKMQVRAFAASGKTTLEDIAELDEEMAATLLGAVESLTEHPQAVAPAAELPSPAPAPEPAPSPAPAPAPAPASMAGGV